VPLAVLGVLLALACIGGFAAYRRREARSARASRVPA
jgi:hypothetical protein